MRLKVDAVCNIGNSRDTNEDVIMVPGGILRDENISFEYETEEVACFAVADGMGGHNAGEVASLLAVESLNEMVSSLDEGKDHLDLQSHFQRWATDTNALILREGDKDPGKRNMGTTIVALVFYYGGFYMVNIGDSRLYRYRNGLLKQLSRDHSLAEMTGNREIPPNIIVNSLGAGAGVFVDFADFSEKTHDQDLFLLCSDGLSDYVSHETLEQLMAYGDSRLLLDQALKAESRDNISALLVHVNRPL